MEAKRAGVVASLKSCAQEDFSEALREVRKSSKAKASASKDRLESDVHEFVVDLHSDLYL